MSKSGQITSSVSSSSVASSLPSTSEPTDGSASSLADPVSIAGGAPAPQHRRSPSWPFWVTLVVAIAALVASAVLLVDYVKPAPVFCAADGGCGAVKRTIFAYPFGIPMPAIGLSGLLAIALASFVPGRRARILQAVLAVSGGLVAAGLLVVQALLHTVCPYCAVVDGSVVVLAGLSLARAVRGWEPPADRRLIGGAVLGLVAGVAVPLGIGYTRKPLPADLPPVIAEEIRKGPRGKVTVVDFVDFECPFCRMTHVELQPVLEANKSKVHVVRRHVPLAMHPHAKDAARAACCGEEMGKGDEMANALFSAPTDKLTPDGCVELAKQLGLDADKFKACVASPATEARLTADRQIWRDSKGHGLPTLWFGAQKLEGAQDAETLRSTLATAIKEL